MKTQKNNKCTEYGLPKYFIDEKKRKRRIIGIENMSYDDLKNEINNGHRFLVFEFVLSFILFFYQKNSDIYFSKNQNAVKYKKISYSIISAFSFVIMILFLKIADFNFIKSMSKDIASIIALIFLVLWFGGITLMPIIALIINIRGGNDVTKEMLIYIENNKIDN